MMPSMRSGSRQTSSFALMLLSSHRLLKYFYLIPVCKKNHVHISACHQKSSIVKPCDKSGKAFRTGIPSRQTLCLPTVSTKPLHLALSLPYAANGRTTHEYSYTGQTQMPITYSRLDCREADLNVVLNCRTTIQSSILPTGNTHNYAALRPFGRLPGLTNTRRHRN